MRKTATTLSGTGRLSGVVLHMDQTADFIVIGAGIAGVSVAAELAARARVVLLEMESQPSCHATGRSAAMFAPTYGPPAIRALTRASGAFFQTPPAGFCEVPLLSRRNVLMIARADQMATFQTALADVSAETSLATLDARDLLNANPLLREGYAQAGYLDSASSDIDVASLVQGFLRTFRGAGGVLVRKAQVCALERSSGIWRATSAAGTFHAPVIINAAGAWADAVGSLARAGHIGLTPRRRTALTVAAPGGIGVDRLPLTVDIDECFYLKPDAGRLLISPADETPSPPCDAQAEEIDVAICIDRIETAFELRIRHVASKWAGLRSFVADKVPVVGFSPCAEGFFWLAGQGGYGIQTAPALSRLAAALALGEAVPADLIAAGFDPATVRPERLSAERLRDA